MTKKHRISVSENYATSSTFITPIDVENFKEFVNYLNKERVKTFNLKYRSIMDEIPDFQEMGLAIDNFKQEHFDWLVEKTKWESRSFKL